MRRSILPLLVLVLTGCGSGSSHDDDPHLPPPDEEYEPGPGVYSFALEDLTLTDTARDDREVPVRIYAPALEDGSGPFPVIVFSHGLGESREAFPFLGEYWAEHGYAAVFLTHVGHDREALEDGDISDVGSPEAARVRTGDMSFVIDELVAGTVSSPLLEARIDLRRLVAGGQCAGSSTAQALGGLAIKIPDDPSTSFRDERVHAVMALSPQMPYGSMTKFLNASGWQTMEVPTLVMTGTADFNWVAEVRADPGKVNVPYEANVMKEKFLVEIAGAAHHAFTATDPWYPGGERDPRHWGWMQQATVAFLDVYARDNQAALTWLVDGDLEKATAGACRQENGLVGPDPDPAGELYGAEAGPCEVATIDTLVIHDDQRDKDLQFRVTHPAAGGPFPLILFSHAVQGSKDDYAELITHWAGHGYVVIQPDHVDSPNVGDMSQEEAVAAWDNRPQDMSLLLDRLNEIDRLAPVLAGKIDRERVAAAGHYIGAATSNLLLGTRSYTAGDQFRIFTDERVDLSLAMSPTGLGQGLHEDSWCDLHGPMMVMTGSLDPSARTGNPPVWRTDPYVYVPGGDKYLVWIEGLTSKYAGLPAGEDPDPEMASWILSSTTAYFDAYLANEEIDTITSGRVDLSCK